MLNEGFTRLERGNTLPSTTHKPRKPCTRPSASTTELLASSPARKVPQAWAVPVTPIRWTKLT